MRGRDETQLGCHAVYLALRTWMRGKVGGEEGRGGEGAPHSSSTVHNPFVLCPSPPPHLCVSIHCSLRLLLPHQISCVQGLGQEGEGKGRKQLRSCAYRQGAPPPFPFHLRQHYVPSLLPPPTHPPAPASRSSTSRSRAGCGTHT